jgi:molecular chaperone GrpE
MANKEANNEETQNEEKETEPEEKEIEAPEPHEKEELENVKKQLGEEKDRFLRLNAEFDNFRKRTLKEREELIKYANEKLILEMIDVYEGLERGLENAKKTDDRDKLIEGMELIYTQFKSVLEKNGLVPIKAQGEKFDPYKHEAMMQTLTDEYEDGTILEELARGYMLNNRVIRYSKVRVSKKKEEVKNEVK